MKHIHLAIAAAMGTLFVQANTYTLTNILNDATTFRTGSCWSGGFAPTDASAAGHDFEITMSGMRTPNTSTTFLCNSLKIGTANTSVTLYMKEGSWSFPETSDGLEFVRVNFDDWTDGKHTYTISGPVKFSDAYSSGYACAFHSAQSKANGIVHDFTGKVTAPSGAKLKNYMNSYTENRWYGIRFSGDLTEFYGMMEMGYSSRLEIGETTMPGKIMTSQGSAIIAHVAGSAGFSVGSVDFVDGTTIEFRGDRNSGTCQTITVTDSYVQSGTIRVVLSAETFDGQAAAAVSYPVLVAPAGTVLDETKFVCSTPGSNIAVRPNANGRSTLYVDRVAYITRNANKEYYNSTETWSDGQVPHGDADYYSGNVGGNFRLCEVGTAPYVSPVNSLTIANQNAITQFKEMTVSNINLAATVVFTNWHEGDKSTNTQYAAGGTKILHGNINNGGFTMKFASSVAIYFIFDCNISGSAGLSISRSSYVTTYVELSGDNSFTGVINADSNLDSKPASDFSNSIHLCFSDVKNLGGNPASFANDKTKLRDYVTLKALATTTLDRMNRGILVGESAFEVVEGATLTIKQPIRFTAGKNLHKFGTGTLCLAGELDLENNSNPTILVEDGGIMAGSTNSFSGTTVAFSGDGKLIAPAPAVAAEDVALYGLKNTVAATPFTFNAAGLLPVHIEGLGAPRSCSIPLFTVSQSAAGAIRGKVSVDKVASGWKTLVGERANADGSVTFLAHIVRQGFMIDFK